MPVKNPHLFDGAETFFLLFGNDVENVATDMFLATLAAAKNNKASCENSDASNLNSGPPNLNSDASRKTAQHTS